VGSRRQRDQPETVASATDQTVATAGVENLPWRYQHLRRRPPKIVIRSRGWGRRVSLRRGYL